MSRQEGDLISHRLFFQNKKRRLKIKRGLLDKLVLCLRIPHNLLRFLRGLCRIKGMKAPHIGSFQNF
jgi:hypothetical protein